MKADIVLIGGGGHCRSCIDVVESSERYRVFGIIAESDPGFAGSVPYLGRDDDMNAILAQCQNFLVAIGYIQSPDVRIRLYEKAARLTGANLPIVAAASAVISRTASIGPGTIVMHHALINSFAVVGENCIVNSGAIVEHDVRVGAHSHVSTGAVVNGECIIGARVFIGSGSIIRNGVQIADDVRVGMGAVVINDLTKPGWYVGNPARLRNEVEK